MQELDRLNDKTYALQHNPNCPSPFLIRLVGRGQGRLDLAPYTPVWETKDRLFFGKTLKEAVELAVS